MNVVFGLVVLAIDVHAGMPLWWTLGEGPPIALFGAVIGVLARGSARSGSSSAAPMG
jgi:hypothetical protein